MSHQTEAEALSDQAPIRVLVVDDSAVVRKIVTQILEPEPGIEVVATAPDPYIARDKILRYEPDVVTLDIEMPRMDGLSFLKILMDQHPIPTIIMSSLSQRGSETAMEALQVGAVDVLGKPDGPFSVGHLGPQLIQKIRAAAASSIKRRRRGVSQAPFQRKTEDAPVTGTTAPAPVQRAPSVRPSYHSGPPPEKRPVPVNYFHPRQLILLGASTGGTEALRQILTRMPSEVPGILIVQHIPAYFSRAFADRLNDLCAFRVREAVDGDRVEPGLALVAPGDWHMLLRSDVHGFRVSLRQGPMVWHQRPAVDVLFQTAAEAVGSHAVAAILTGMGRDGAEGMLKLRQNGARCFSQDAASCVVYGMPKAAWELQASECQVPLDRMSEVLMGAVEQKRPRGGAAIPHQPSS